MKEEAIALVKGISDPAQRLNILREYLQALVLRSLHESESFKCLAFVGGTALRFAYGLPRFSEDLDFSMDSSAGYAGEKWMRKVKHDLALAGLDASVNWNDRKVVHTSWVRIGGLLKPAGLAAMPEQKLSIKIEIDTNPPRGARTENQVIERHRMFAVKCHDLPSLMAGKLHALITRAYPKGRDWYDLTWYRARRPPEEPNLELLQNALNQTQGPGIMNGARWRRLVKDQLAKLDVAKVRQEILPFLERKGDADLISRANILSLLADPRPDSRESTSPARLNMARQ